MRNGWEKGGIQSLQGNSLSHSPQHKVSDDQARSQYDFGLSTADRSVSAPPPSEMGFEPYTSKILDGLDGWNSDEVGGEESNKTSRYDGMNFDDDVNPIKDHISSFFNGDPIARSKSAAPQFNVGIFESPNDNLESETNSLFQDFDIMTIGSRRSASAGVIHDTTAHSSVIDSLGLSSHEISNSRKQQSFMDLIQEDVPAKSVELNNHRTEPLNLSNHAHSHHGHPQKFYQMHGHGSLNEDSRPPGLLQQNQMNQVPMQTMPAYHYSTQQSQASRPPEQSYPNPHVQSNQPQTMYGQAPGVSYYDSYQRGNDPTHQNHPHMYPQVVQSNANEPSPMYVNPSYGGGYAAMQYHKASPQTYPQAQVMHAHDSNMNSRIPHPQYITAIPIHGISGQSNGGYIYFQQPGPGMAPVPSHHAQHIGIDATGQQAKIVSPGRMQVPGRSPSKAPSAIGGKVEKTGRKATRNSRKGPNAASIDGSRHSLSSGTLNLLEDYRSSKDKSWTATDVKGHIVEFCQDQNGSRFVQQRLEVANDDEKAFIVSEVLPAVKILRNDVFGNYVVQKLFEHCNYDLKTQLKQTLVGEMVELSSQIYGCRVVQKALEKMNDDDLIDLLTEFHISVLACIHDQNGNHVIQKIIEIVSYRSRTYQADSQKRAVNFSKELQFILDCVVKNIVSLSCHPFGCRVMQRILEHCVDSQKSAALECIQKHLRALFDDQYGNYVIQHVLQFGRKSDRDIVLQIVIENGILGLSRQKFASNVIEKLLKYGNGAHRNAIVREMLKMVDDKTVESGQCTIVLLMVRDAYANYVVQTTLDVVPEGNDKELLLQELRNNSSKLRNYTFAKHIITKLEEADGKLNSRV